MGASCAVWQGQAGVNFAVYSHHAERIEVCLFDSQGVKEIGRIQLPECTNGVWHGFVAGLAEGQLYGLRGHGPYQPKHGKRFNPAKLLIDPFARALVGNVNNLSLEVDYLGLPDERLATLDALADPVDNAERIPKAMVVDQEAELRAGAALMPGPRVSLARTVLYEAHVKGLTKLHPDVSAQLRASYAGLVSGPMLAHYARLGITTLCLLPVHLHITERHLLKKGLQNYWGYNTLGYFIPEPSYASGQFESDRAEFRHMVDQLHRHGLEVVLDVVFNHSAESDTWGPTLSWRGLDNARWYRLDHDGQYLNFSGCGNSLDLSQSCGVQLVMDSMRWWVQAFGVDGFRFDLATSLGRDSALHHRYHPLAGLLTAIGQDPVLATVKCIAEPWDLGPDGYRLGQFPAAWQEWNDHFRDTTRAFWLGFDCTRGNFAQALTGSSKYFNHGGRSPLSSINLITAHDGMTLADLTSYRDKHNLANGEGGRDGHGNNLSANAGVEGPSQDEGVQQVRGQWQRALLATLFVAQGTPQLLAGDEIGHTQNGNNNAYCQDNETSWLNWTNQDDLLTGYLADLIHLRHAHSSLRHARWFSGKKSDIVWLRPDGGVMLGRDWDDRQARSFACQIEVADPGDSPMLRWLLMFNPSDLEIQFALPLGDWAHVLDSSAAMALPQAKWCDAQSCRGDIKISPRSLFGLVQTLEHLG